MIQEEKPDRWQKIGLNRKLKTSAFTFTATEISRAAKVNELSGEVIILAQKVAKMLLPDRASCLRFVVNNELRSSPFYDRAQNASCA